MEVHVQGSFSEWRITARRNLVRSKAVRIKFRVIDMHFTGTTILFLFLSQTLAVKMHFKSPRRATRCTKTSEFHGWQRIADVVRTTVVWLCSVTTLASTSLPPYWQTGRGLDCGGLSGTGQAQVCIHVKRLCTKVERRNCTYTTVCKIRILFFFTRRSFWYTYRLVSEINHVRFYRRRYYDTIRYEMLF